eukprot:9489405-Pyramimonas_sp.AAC.1
MQGGLPPTVLVVDVVPLAPVLVLHQQRLLCALGALILQPRFPLGLHQRVDARLQVLGRRRELGGRPPPVPSPRQVCLGPLLGRGAPRPAAAVIAPGQHVAERGGREVASAPG